MTWLLLGSSRRASIIQLGYGELRTFQPDPVRIIEIANSLASPTNQRAGKNVDELGFPLQSDASVKAGRGIPLFSRAICPLDGRCGR